LAENILKLIPLSPEFIPNDDSIKKALDLLKIFLPSAGETIVKLTKNVRFIDPGSNLLKIRCPYSKNELDITWWQEAMDVAYQSSFKNLMVILPCCKKSISLNELHYEWPAGFARFSVEVKSPNGDIDNYQLKSLEEIMNCPLKKIIAHY
jgi:hypothetical protein